MEGHRSRMSTGVFRWRYGDSRFKMSSAQLVNQRLELLTHFESLQLTGKFFIYNLCFGNLLYTEITVHVRLELV